MWAFEYLLWWSWGFASLRVCLGWGESIGVSVWAFIAMKFGFFKFRGVFGLGWDYWCERLSVYCNRVRGFQGIGQQSNKHQAI